ncbi:MAG: acetylneuraminic acid synthetase [Candidatus Lokiarchaeota archaeon]|nr:acetylneuraminic acid synthetase [Candidatus Lokiarchaeota archaeon]
MKKFEDIIEKDDVLIIAELGVNYYDIAIQKDISPMEAAKLMIDEAKKNGADAVKFQSYKAEDLASKNAAAYWDLEKEPSTSQLELFKKFDKFGKEEYIEIFEYCKFKNIIFLSTPFDYKAVDYLNDLVPVFKISSSDITNIPFIRYISSKGKPIILSTGAATLNEIEEAVRAIRSIGDNQIYFMHCILDYPTKYKDINLNMIKTLRKLFPDNIIGFSDHTRPDEFMLVPVIAFAYGARIIEKHFTLDKTIVGNDHYHAMDQNDLKKLRENISFVKLISGQFEIEPLECEKISRQQARRSLVAAIDISKGEIITLDMLTFKRPGIGISPAMIDSVIGGIALVDIKEDDILTSEKIKFKE